MKFLTGIFFTLIFVVAVLQVGCTSFEENDRQAKEIFTCPMHPSVRSDRPAACPICGMDLVKITEMPSADTPGAENILYLMPRQQKLANIKTEKVKTREIGENNLLLGTVAADPRSTETITAKIPGRIEKLFIRNPQDKVFSGQAIYEIYSEELLVDQKEFLLAIKKLKDDPDNSTLKLMRDASKNKLLQWGMSSRQLDQLAAKGIASASTVFYSPANGYLQTIEVREGQYVEIGTVVVTLVKLNKVWIEAQVYPEELSILNKDPGVLIEAEGVAEPIKAKRIFNAPTVEENSRVTLARFEIENPDVQLKPGTMVYVRLQTPGKQALVIPKSAILPEKMPTVWVKIGSDAFERRMLKLGTQNRHFAEVLDGLKENENIVISGAYLVNSEFILKKGATQSHNH